MEGQGTEFRLECRVYYPEGRRSEALRARDLLFDRFDVFLGDRGVTIFSFRAIDDDGVGIVFQAWGRFDERLLAEQVSQVAREHPHLAFACERSEGGVATWVHTAGPCTRELAMAAVRREWARVESLLDDKPEASLWGVRLALQKLFARDRASSGDGAAPVAERERDRVGF